MFSNIIWIWTAYAIVFDVETAPQTFKLVIQIQSMEGNRLRNFPQVKNENDKIVYFLPRKPACFSQSIYISATILKLLFYKLCYESVVASYDIW